MSADSTSSAARAGADAEPGRGRPRTVDRERFVEAALSFLDQGRSLATVSVNELCVRAGAGKGSFYSPGHYRQGKRSELDDEVIYRFQRDRKMETDVLDSNLRAVSSPSKRLQIIQSFVAGGPARVAGMRNWAIDDPAAAAAVGKADQPVLDQISRALKDRGFSAGRARALAGIVLTACLTAEPAEVQVLLTSLSPAGGASQDSEVEETPGEVPGESFYFYVPGGAPDEVRDRILSAGKDWIVSYREGESRERPSRRRARGGTSARS